MSNNGLIGSFLGEIDLQWYIIDSAQRALFDQIPEPLQQYSFLIFHSDDIILLRAEVRRELTEAEMECLAVAETEICADFGGNTPVKTEVVIIPVGQRLRPLAGGIAFTRNQKAELGS